MTLKTLIAGLLFPEDYRTLAEYIERIEMNFCVSVITQYTQYKSDGYQMVNCITGNVITLLIGQGVNTIIGRIGRTQCSV